MQAWNSSKQEMQRRIAMKAFHFTESGYSAENLFGYLHVFLTLRRLNDLVTFDPDPSSRASAPVSQRAGETLRRTWD